MASCDDAEWYLEGSGVPVGWKERAVGFSVVPFPFAAAVSFWIVPGAMLDGVDANVG
jgi:hypothetical protein